MNQPSVTGFESIVKRIGDLPETLHGLQDVLLANLAMIAEIPAPTFAEDARAGFVQERFAEMGYSDCSMDEVGNVAGVLPGSESTDGRNILLVAHTDTAVAATVDHTVVVQPDRVTGPSVADNALGLAVVAAMPAVLERLGLSLRSTVLGLACSRGLGRGSALVEGTLKLDQRRGVEDEAHGLSRMRSAALTVRRSSAKPASGRTLARASQSSRRVALREPATGTSSATGLPFLTSRK